MSALARPGLALALLAAGLPALAAPLQRPEPLSRAEIVRLAKPATAFVDVPRVGTGSAFCIHSSGLFVTNEHVVRGIQGSATVDLVLDAGLTSQKVLRARVLRSDRDLDLALLQVEGKHTLPALRLGNDHEITELAELVALGFPFGKRLGSGAYPTVTVNVVNVSSLRTDGKGELERIQVDSVLNPGNSGGPVVDRSGTVVGVVVAGIRGAGINLLIPVRRVQRFLEKPVIAFAVPAISRKSQHDPADFQARVVSHLGALSDLELELVLASDDGKERRFPMKGSAGVYQVKAPPFPGSKGDAPVRLILQYEEGRVEGETKDRAFKVGDQEVRLSEVKTLRPGASTVVELDGGKSLRGVLADLDTLPVRLGGRSFDLPVAGALEVSVTPEQEEASVRCVVVARRSGKEVGRHEAVIHLDGTGTRTATRESLPDGKLVRPRRAAVATTYLHAVSTQGDYIGQGKTYRYGGADLKVAASSSLINVKVDGWDVTFSAPRGGLLAVGEYPNAKRFPFHDSSPGLSFTGHGRGSNRVGGAFAIWEMVLTPDGVEKLAIDFVHRSEEKGPPLYGKLRINSSFE